MKTFKNLFPQVYDFEALYRAYARARRGKRHQNEVLRFERDLEENLIQIQNELIWGTYRTSEYHTFWVSEPKKRQVAALPFRDRVVQHALVAALEPIWEARFIEHSYACRPGKGVHAGADQATRWMRQIKRNHGRVYAMQADIRQYFPSIGHDRLAELLARHIGCRRTLDLCREIISSWRPGLPIGNLPSQLWANIYLHALDMHIKQHCREHYYMRYMDDFVVMSHSKSHLHELRRHLDGWLLTELGLRLNSKTQVFPIGPKPLDFLGYRMWPTHRKLRKRSIRRLRKTLRKLQKEYAGGRIDLATVQRHLVSWLGHARHAQSHTSRQRVLSDIAFRRSS